MVRGKAAPLMALLSVLLLALAMGACSNSSSAGSSADAKPRVVIIHSYDGDFRWTAEQNQGILDGLARAGYKEGDQYDLRVFYMDTRLNFKTPEEIQVRADIATRTIDEFKPSLVFVTDDAAVNYVALPYLEAHPDTDISFVFSGVNGDPSTYPMVQSLEHPGAPITGTLERIPFQLAFEAAAKLFAGSKKVVLLADDSPSSKDVVDSFNQEVQAGESMALQPVDFLQITTFEQWKQAIEDYQDKADAIAVLNYHRIEDGSGNIMPAKEVAQWTVQNSKIPVFGLISDWSADGFVMSFGNSGYKTGLYVGLRGADILDGKPAGDMPILDPEEYETTYNVDTAQQTGLDIPPEDLLDAAEIYPQH